MRKNKREGFQFSFGLKPEEDNYSSRSTPKFPSIEISKAHPTPSQRRTYQFNSETQPIEIRKLPLDLFMEIGGGIELLQKKTKMKQKAINDKIIPPFPLNDNLSVDSKDNKSVKSTKSLGQRFLKNTNKLGVEKTIKINTNKKHSNSLSNILQLKLQSPSSKRKQQRRNLFGFKQSNFSLSKVITQPKEQKKNQNQDTLKLQNNLFQSDSSNMEFRETKKMVQTFERSKVHLADRQKSKVFKNFIHKPRPALRFVHRGMNNQKIQSISRIFQDKTN